MTDEEFKALQDFVLATNVADKCKGWSDFAIHRDPSKLQGVKVDINGSVVEILLANKGLRGSIPESLGGLINLRELRLNRNQLTGSIPASLGELIKLEYLSLRENQLTGTIPESFGELVNLTSLWLFDNKLTGSIPESFSKLVKLTSLELQNNKLTGWGTLGGPSSLEEWRRGQGRDGNVITGGRFEPYKLGQGMGVVGVVLGVLLGYFDLVSDVLVTVEWANKGEWDLAVASIAFMCLPTLISILFVNKFWEERLMSLFQVRLLKDAFDSIYCQEVTAGYGTVRFIEGVYEAMPEAMLQTYSIYLAAHKGETIEYMIVVSVVLSIASVTSVLVLFLERDTLEASDTKRVQKLGLYSYYACELCCRTFAVGLLALAVGLWWLVGVLVAMFLRCLVRRIMDEDEQKAMPTPLLLASLLSDAIWPSIRTYRVASMCSCVENASIFACVLFWSDRSDFGEHTFAVHMCVWLSVISRLLFQMVVMEQSWGKFHRSAQNNIQASPNHYIEKAACEVGGEGVQNFGGLESALNNIF